MPPTIVARWTAPILTQPFFARGNNGIAFVGVGKDRAIFNPEHYFFQLAASVSIELGISLALQMIRRRGGSGALTGAGDGLPLIVRIDACPLRKVSRTK